MEAKQTIFVVVYLSKKLHGAAPVFTCVVLTLTSQGGGNLFPGNFILSLILLAIV